jgi:hypothetical protein
VLHRGQCVRLAARPDSAHQDWPMRPGISETAVRSTTAEYRGR